MRLGRAHQNVITQFRGIVSLVHRSCAEARATDRRRLLSGPYYLAEQLGFRKIIDTTFMIATMIHGDPDPEDLRKFFRALRRAQRDLDLRPDRYTHYYKNEFPERFHPLMDTRRWGPGERLVFEPYTKEAHDETFDWITRRGIFAEGEMGDGRYEDSALSLEGGEVTLTASQ